MKKILALFLLIAGAAHLHGASGAPVPVTADANGRLRQPANFFTANGGAALLPASRTYLVFLGDSITRGTNSGDAATPIAYPFLLTNYTTWTNSLYFTNAAFSGYSFLNASNVFYANVLPNLPRPAGAGTNVIVSLMIGANDLTTGGGAAYAISISNWCNALHTNNYKVALCTTLPRTTWAEAATEPDWVTLANYILTATNIDFVIDTAAALADSTDAQLYSDGTHPTQFGQQCLANAWDLQMRFGCPRVPKTSYRFGAKEHVFAGGSALFGPLKWTNATGFTPSGTNLLWSGGNFRMSTDNVWDIGPDSSSRPRKIAAATQLISGDSVQCANSGNFQTVSRGYILFPSDGVFGFYDNGGTTFGRLQFGGTAATHPAIKRNGAGLELVRAAGVGASTNHFWLGGTVYPTNGVSSYASNLLAVTSIAVSGNPFLWTNTIGININVFVDGGTVTGIGLNGSFVFTSAGKTIPLQPGEWITVTNSVAPTATWKPL
jgi:lysophospholipase L1-like esterase